MSHSTRTAGNGVRASALDVDNVAARAAVSNLTAAQVAQRQRDMMSSQIQNFDAKFSGSTQATTTGASGTGTGTTHLAWLNGIGAQFAGPLQWPSGKQRGAINEKVYSGASDRNGRLLTLNRSDVV